MSVALVSATTGALKPVIEKLAALVGGEFRRVMGVRGEIRSLTQELAAMDAFLLKMSEEEDPHEQDKVWMNQVRELSYDMEDSIDDFIQQVGDKETKPDGLLEKIKYSLGELGKVKTWRRIGKEIEDLKKQIIEVGDRNARYRTGIATSSKNNEKVDPRALAIFEHASELVGIDKPKAELIRMLTPEDRHGSMQPHLKLVAIVASGGMGKTTLANQVYQDFKGQCNCRSFVSVSRNPNIMNILRTILCEVTGKNYPSTYGVSVQHLISKINHFLADKRYFVVIDDIWDTDTWDVIKCAFPMNIHRSRIITTTRISNVAEACRSSFNGNTYQLSSLSMVHAEQLFCRRLFGSKEDFPSHLREVSDQILQKCAGLPLAIIAISGLLANKGKTENLWNQVKESMGRGLERDSSVRKMMDILSLSYYDLPPHLKSCLLYMSIFPEDFIIEKKCLIRRWIGEGFIHKADMYTAHEIGERCFNELLNRGLIQPVKINEDDTVRTCRVHDTILDFIISKSIEQKFVTIVGVPLLTIRGQSKVVRRLSLQVDKQTTSTTPTAGLVLSHARSLHVFPDSIKIPSLKEFRHLRVLHLKHYRQLEKHDLENMVRLFQLRYLNLKNTGINELPKQIGRLGCLEMLDIRQTNIRELPASIVNLRKLSHLFVGSLVEFSYGIENMQALETLKRVMVFNQSLDFLLSLGRLNNLRNLALDLQSEDISLTEDIIVVRKKRLVSSLCELGTQNLRSLRIQKGMLWVERPWCPTRLTLEKLITWRSVNVQVPKWLSSLRNLHEVRLEVEGVKQDDLCILGALPNLFFLHLRNSNHTKERLRIRGDLGFPCLRIFNYAAGWGPSDLMFRAGSMPMLEKLVLSMQVAEDDSLDFGISNLPRNIISKCSVRRIPRPSAQVQRAASPMAQAVAQGISRSRSQFSSPEGGFSYGSSSSTGYKSRSQFSSPEGGFSYGSSSSTGYK